MSLWKTLSLACAAIAFATVAQADCGGTHGQTASNETTAGKLMTNGSSLNKLAVNRVVANRLAANKISLNRLSANTLVANGPSDGAAADVLAIVLPNGSQLSR